MGSRSHLSANKGALPLQDDPLDRRLASLLIRQPCPSPPTVESNPAPRDCQAGQDSTVADHEASLTVASPQAHLAPLSDNDDSICFFSASPASPAGCHETDYFDKAERMAGVCMPMPSSPGSTHSFTTSFGRRRQKKERAENGSADSFAQAGMLCMEGHDMQRSGSVDLSVDTGNTTPLSSSDYSYSQDQGASLWPEERIGSQDRVEDDDDESGDQTTWKRFREGGVIEPPEMDYSPGSSAEMWKKIDKASPAAPGSRYTSMISKRHRPSPAPDLRPMSLVPTGGDGRSFRFVDRVEQPPESEPASPGPKGLESDDRISLPSPTVESLPPSTHPDPIEVTGDGKLMRALICSSDQQMQTIRVSHQSRARLARW